MSSGQKSHVVRRCSIEHALLASASVDLPRTRRQLLVIAVQNGLKLHDYQTTATALRRLSANGSLQVRRGPGALCRYCLTPRGEQVLQVFTESPP